MNMNSHLPWSSEYCQKVKTFQVVVLGMNTGDESVEI